MKIYTKAPEVLKIARIAFPGYDGHKYAVDTAAPSRLDSYWEGGSRDYFALVNLETGQTIPVPENGTPFSNGGQIFTLQALPLNIALVQHTIFRGKDLGLTVFVSPDNMNRMALPALVELSLAQRIVMTCTRERKSSYNGRNRQQMAFDDCGLPAEEWEKAKADCIAAGWLKANGAITDEGRNVTGTQQLWNLKWVQQGATV